MADALSNGSRDEFVAIENGLLGCGQRKRAAGAASEKRMAMIHRVIVPDEGCPKEYVVLVTDRRSVFIRLERTRRSFVLRGETRFGTALVTDVIPKSLEDYEQVSLESLTADTTNFVVPHEAVVSLSMDREEPRFRARDLFVWLTMRRQGESFQVYNFEMNYQLGPDRETSVKFYAVPLGAYFKPRRQTRSRGTILREYAMDAFEIFQRVIPASIMSS